MIKNKINRIIYVGVAKGIKVNHKGNLTTYPVAP